MKKQIETATAPETSGDFDGLAIDLQSAAELIRKVYNSVAAAENDPGFPGLADIRALLAPAAGRVKDAEQLLRNQAEIMLDLETEW